MQKVILPNGETVEVASTFEPETWFVHEKTGYIDPRLLAPYPDQPRKHIDPALLEELETSVAASGVRESLLVTPVSMAPWANLAHDDERPFLVVSGHRRRSSSIKAELPAVPFKIRVYKNKADFDLDATALNDHRVDLSPIEEGWSYRNKIDGGEKITHIVKKTGRAYQWLVDRINLTYLCPTIQAQISPTLDRRRRLAEGFASALGGIALKSYRDSEGRERDYDEEYDFEDKLEELDDTEPVPANLSNDEKRFRLQRAYLAHCKRRGWKGTDSKAFVKTGKEPSRRSNGSYGGGTGHHKESSLAGYEMPSHPRKRLAEWFKFLGDTGFLEMSESEIDLALGNVVKRDLVSMVGILSMTQQILQGAADKKKEFSDLALGDHKRLEQGILEAL